MHSDFSASSTESFTPKSLSRLWPWLILASILMLVTIIRLRIASCPLERDEGEYAFMGQLILQGIPPYTEAANMKFPGTYAMFAMIEAVFGQTAEGIHQGLLVVNLVTILLMYHLGKVIFTHVHMAVMSAAIYAVSSLSYSFLGAMAHATHFVVLFGLAGLALLFAALKGQSPIRFALAGLVTGLAYLAKQSGFYFVPFGCLVIIAESNWRLISPSALRALAYFIAGAFAPFALTVYIFQQLGALDNFVFWTLCYASTYGPTLKYAFRMLFLHIEIILSDGLAWVFFISGILCFLPVVWRAAYLPRRTMVLLALFLTLSLAGVSLGLSFRNHYYIQVLPAVALLSVLFFSTAANRLCRRDSRKATLISSLLCLSFCGAVLVREAPRFFFTAPDQINRDIYRGNPFVESVAIANYIKQHSNAQDRIFVFGNEPEIYFYAGRHTAASYLYLYSLFEAQPFAKRMQLNLIAEITLHRPRFFIETNLGSFPPEIEKILPLYQWKAAYLAENYRPVFSLDLNYPDNKMTLGDAMLSHTSPTGRFIAVWERKL